MADFNVKYETMTTICVKLSDPDDISPGEKNYYWYIKKVTDIEYTYIDHWWTAGGDGDEIYIYENLEPSTTYDIRCAVQYWDANGVETYSRFTIQGTTRAVSSRPKPWKWEYPKIKGQPVKVGAGEWNRFTQYINDMRAYKDLQLYEDFSTVKPGEEIRAVYMRQAGVAIYMIDPLGGDLEMSDVMVPDGSPISAKFFNKLRNALNAIP